MRIGPYEVVVTPRPNCRRMILRCRRQDAALHLSVPVGMAEGDIRAFLEKNIEWIRRQMGAQPAWQPQYAPGERHYCLGRLVTLGADAPAGEAAFRRWRSEQLKPVLMRLLQKWAPLMGVRVTHVTLQEMTSRWGSCRAATGRLTFNTRLGMFAEGLIEETVVHELCHFFHQNHSAAFYREMDKWLPDWRMRKKMRDEMDIRPRPGGV